MSPSGQIEPPGMHMIYLPYSDDIRPIEEVIVLLFTLLMREFNIDNNMADLQFHTDTTYSAPRASEDQIKSASSLVKRIDLKNFSVCQFANPGNQPLFSGISHVMWMCIIIFYVSCSEHGESIFWKDNIFMVIFMI